MDLSSFSADTKVEKVNYGKWITVSGTKIGSYSVKFLKFYVDCLVRADK
jgi:hypothetical protein